MSRARRAAAALLIALAALALLAPAGAGAAKKKRIVALTPFAANTLAKLGVKPVAIGEGQDGVKLDKRLRKVPRLPLSHSSNGPNLEQLAQRDPDIVLSERTWNAGHGAIRNLGIRVVEKEPYKVGQVARKVKAIGKLVGRSKKARKVGARIQKQVRRSTKGIDSNPRVLMILGVGQTPYAFLGDSWGGDLVRRAGGSLLTDGLSNDGDEDLLVSGGFAQISDEEIIAFNPDVIIAVPHGRADDIDAIAESLREDETFEVTNAGQNDRVYVDTSGQMLQATTNPAGVISKIRRSYLLNR